MKGGESGKRWVAFYEESPDKTGKPPRRMLEKDVTRGVRYKQVD